MKRARNYASDLTDGQWQVIRQLLPKPARRGRKRIYRRWVIDAILYVTRTGCQWRMLPKNFPNWNTVYGVFRQWKHDGTWERIHDALRAKVRKAVGKKPTPTAAIVDSQSIRTAEGGEKRGYDAGKKITGRKRHIAVGHARLAVGDCRSSSGLAGSTWCLVGDGKVWTRSFED